ncbi:hypothetical protein QJS10_CPB18g01700 [Acorus calamus]|uniref:Uncharacterized protein n=1 Tax=Acorus calamus TaxID=4465 RepID=A0AAV9CMT4_ACOCL|nr:hypothetical protein QJS10_CPB18g01700 [Acorus calamus]
MQPPPPSPSLFETLETTAITDCPHRPCRRAGNDCHHRAGALDLTSKPETTTQSHIRPTKKNSGTGPGNKKNSLSVTDFGFVMLNDEWVESRDVAAGVTVHRRVESRVRQWKSRCGESATVRLEETFCSVNEDDEGSRDIYVFTLSWRNKQNPGSGYGGGNHPHYGSCG